MTPSTEPPPYPFRSRDPLALAEQYADFPDAVRVTFMPSGMPGWILTRYKDVRAGLRDPRLSRAAADQLQIDGYPSLPGFMLGSDGADHEHLREVVKGAFTREAVDERRPGIERAVEALLDELLLGGRDGEPADLLEHFALPLAMDTVGQVLGIPKEDRLQFRQWGDAFLTTSSSSRDASLAAQESMMRYLGGLIAQRRAEPEEDLLSAMIQSGKLAEHEMFGLPIEIMLAGWETVAAAVTNFVFWLLTHAEGDETYYRYLHRHPERIGRAVEELLRMLPVGAEDGLPRCALADVEVGGATVAKGDLVVLSHDAANRDPEIFADPHRIDLGRTPNPHMAFNVGPHFCLGAYLARLELNIAIERLTQRLPGLRLAVAPEEIEWSEGTAIRRPLTLPVQWAHD